MQLSITIELQGDYRESILDNSISSRMITRFPLGPENTVQR